MKILVIPSWYPSPAYPNNGSFFREQSLALFHAGAEVSVLVIEIPYRKTKKDFSYFRKHEYNDEGMRVIRYVFPLSFLHRLPRLYYFFLKCVGKRIYKKEFEKRNYMVVQAHSFFIGGYVAACLKKDFGCHCVITEHSSKILRSSLSFWEKQILKECIDVCDHFICVSHNLRDHVEKMTGKMGKAEVFPNMVSCLFDLTEKECSVFRFVSVGNLIAGKKMDLLIEAFVKAFSADERVTLQIVGEGEERSKLENLIRTYNRGNQIQLCGFLKRDQVSEILSRSHVMALVSEKETFGIAYVEALASGNVIVGANNGGANDIICKENGIIVQELTITEVAVALRYVYEHYELYNPGQISRACKIRYGEKAYTEAYFHYLTE